VVAGIDIGVATARTVILNSSKVHQWCGQKVGTKRVLEDEMKLGVIIPEGLQY